MSVGSSHVLVKSFPKVAHASNLQKTRRKFAKYYELYVCGISGLQGREGSSVADLLMTLDQYIVRQKTNER